MFNRKNHKRIFYRPGMISLVFIPLLCLYFFYKNDSFKVYSLFSFGFIEESVFVKKNIPNIRKYKEFNFNNSELIEQNKLSELQVSLRKLKKNNDTINGFKIHFGEKANYAVFFEVLEILTIEDMPIYLPYKNDIWVIIPPARKPSKQNVEILHTICGGVIISKEEELKMEEEIERREFQLMITNIKKYWILFFGYFGIVLLNVFALIKFNRRKIIY